MKTDNLVRYTCDVCKKEEYVNEGQSAPMERYRLPMKYYSETGREQGLTNQAVDLCRKCARGLVNALLNHYDMRSIAYVGVQIEKKGGADNG